MKFCKTYEDFMETEEVKNLPRIQVKKCKKLLKNCRNTMNGDTNSDGDEEESSASDIHPDDSNSDADHEESTDIHSCKECDDEFFKLLLEDMLTVSSCFNKKAKDLLQLQLGSGTRSCLGCLWKSFRLNHECETEEGECLVAYATANAIAFSKLLKKYDKIHHSNKGQALKAKARKMSIEILHSPWLNKLIAFYINKTGENNGVVHCSGSVKNFSLMFDEGKPSLTCTLFNSFQIEIDLTCPICLDTVFDAVSLTCGHIFCYFCACSAASVSVVDGLKCAEKSSKCPLCRQTGVYEGFVYMNELNVLLRRSCPEYWHERLRSERVERVKQTKQYWQTQCQAFTG